MTSNAVEITFKTNNTIKMKKHIVKIRETFFVTHDVIGFTPEKPKDYTFEPGRATEVAINRENWVKEKRPFTFTNLPNDDFLQFIIKTYPSHDGVTKELLSLKNGDELILHDVFGAIAFQGKGIFIAGGAGITPFISIFRNLEKMNALVGNRLIFANKTKDDIILKKEFEEMLGDRFINILSEEDTDEQSHGIITEEFLKSNIANNTDKFYVCGPPPMMESVLKHLSEIGIAENQIITEEL